MKYRKEKERIDEIQKLKQRREELQFTLQEAERRMDLARCRVSAETRGRRAGRRWPSWAEIRAAL
jgi:transcriptional regulator with XRE-family HTH domain